MPSQQQILFLMGPEEYEVVKKPTRYEIIFSTERKFETGEIEEFVFLNCFKDFTYSGSREIPSILKQAQKCLDFNSTVMEGAEVDPRLNNKLYFE